MNKISRRHFIKAGMASSLTNLMGKLAISANKKKIGQRERPAEIPEKHLSFSLGLASYTFRAFSLEQTITMTKRLGLEKICLKDVHLPLTASEQEIKKAAEKIRTAGLNLYACGVVYLERPEEVERVFTYARIAGLSIIVSSPRPELLPLLEKKVKQTDISLAIHNHGPGDKYYPTPADAYEKIKRFDQRIGLCLDIGHAARAGINPSEAAQKFSDRLLDVHLKDVSSASPEGHTVEMGRGVINLAEFLQMIVRLNYHGSLSFEYEKDEKDPLPGLAESVGYVRGLLAGLELSEPVHHDTGKPFQAGEKV
ncbi:MAG: sugar phosphate isomerase/epimerase [Candidatus Aminicenantes bacterium]|nr:sugar phosphate isomerase/epimerase [Candidatus Aminicenantes bacterium]